ncbi:SPOR domain-containing protein, partial [Gemmatimonadota bacterium]
DREDPYSWTVRETPRAFFLGERDSLEDAEDLLLLLETEEIDPYILEVSYRDGSRRYRVLAGAFSGVNDARALQQLLIEAGIEDPPLVERRGRLPE